MLATASLVKRPLEIGCRQTPTVLHFDRHGLVFVIQSLAETSLYLGPVVDDDIAKIR